LRRLLWVLAISGTALALEGIVQRAVGCTRLLFIAQPWVNPDAESQFASYAYRANASQYFNLLWPLCLGLWWRLQQRARPGRMTYFLPVAAAVMAACPFISTSRGGALVSGAMLAATALLFVGAELREQLYADARKMTEDYPLFGTGPGTFGTVFQLYRFSQATYWPEQLHNDWLETLITFGWAGFSLFLAALACVLVAGWRAPRRFAIMAALALAGCLAHARFDFPFQIHSLQFLFLLACAMLLALGARRRRPRPAAARPAPESF
jgi:O-antigen ligase